MEKPSMRSIFQEKIGAGAAVMALRKALREVDINLDGRLPVRQVALTIASEAVTLLSHSSALDLMMQMRGMYEDEDMESPEDIPGRHEEGEKKTFVLVPTNLIQRLSVVAADAARELEASAEAGVRENIFDDTEDGETRDLARDLTGVVAEISARGESSTADQRVADAARAFVATSILFTAAQGTRDENKAFESMMASNLDLVRVATENPGS